MANIADLLGEPLASDLADFRAANYRAKEIEVIREALEEHIKRRLEEPKMLERFNTARERRTSGTKKPLRLVTPEKAC
jgi:hypothetical protein